MNEDPLHYRGALASSLSQTDIRRTNEIARPPHTKSIAEVAASYGVSLRTLRFYEEIGLLFPVRIEFARFYSAKDEVRLQIIIKGKRLGFSLSEIDGLIFKRIGEPTADPPTITEPHDNVLAYLTKREIEDQIQALVKRRDEIVAGIADLRLAQPKKDV